VEASSGNTGIGLAMVCAVKGYPLVCVMAESFSIERGKFLMRFFGARVVLTNPAHKATGMVIKAKELTDKHGFFWTNQFENEANAWIHEQTTGPEIVDAFSDTTLHHFVMAYGTGGTSLGVSRVLRKQFPETNIHICETSNALVKHPTRQCSTQVSQRSIPKREALPHRLNLLIQSGDLISWATDFIPKLVSQFQEENLDINIVPVGGDDAIRTSQQLAKREDIFSCTSGAGKGSTPSLAPPPPPILPGILPGAVSFVQQQIADHKVLIWSLEYCEFCWTLTRFLEGIQVPYTPTIDIDSFQYAKNQFGNKYRAALCDMTDCKTFPQLFIDGKFHGGTADTCMMWKKGEFQTI
jgi:cysteine synthase A